MAVRLLKLYIGQIRNSWHYQRRHVAFNHQSLSHISSLQEGNYFCLGLYLRLGQTNLTNFGP